MYVLNPVSERFDWKISALNFGMSQDHKYLAGLTLVDERGKGEGWERYEYMARKETGCS